MKKTCLNICNFRAGRKNGLNPWFKRKKHTADLNHKNPVKYKTNLWLCSTSILSVKISIKIWKLKKILWKNYNPLLNRAKWRNRVMKSLSHIISKCWIIFQLSFFFFFLLEPFRKTVTNKDLFWNKYLKHFNFFTCFTHWSQD